MLDEFLYYALAFILAPIHTFVNKIGPLAVKRDNEKFKTRKFRTVIIFNVYSVKLDEE